MTPKTVDLVSASVRLCLTPSGTNTLTEMAMFKRSLGQAMSTILISPNAWPGITTLILGIDLTAHSAVCILRSAHSAA